MDTAGLIWSMMIATPPRNSPAGSCATLGRPIDEPTSALDAELGVLYFLAVDSTSGGALVVGVHTGNGTIASTGALPGDAGQAPAALFFVR